MREDKYPFNLHEIDERRRRDGRRLPPAFYHVSPWRLPVGRNIRPRWSPVAWEHGIWMTSSRVAARKVARHMVGDLQNGFSGYAATGKVISEDMRAVWGAWIYRVKPTGPVVRLRRSHWGSNFPVRVMALQDTWGYPAFNRCSPPRKITDESLPRYGTGFFTPYCQPEVGEILADYERIRWVPPRHRAEVWEEEAETYLPSRWVKEVLQILQAAEDADDAHRRLETWKRTKDEEFTVRLKAQRKLFHHKLVPDARYRRKQKHPRRHDGSEE